jgi:hypothetical protein
LSRVIFARIQSVASDRTLDGRNGVDLTADAETSSFQVVSIRR